MKKRTLISVTVGAVVLVVGTLIARQVLDDAKSNGSKSSSQDAPSLINQSRLASLDTASKSSIDPSHLDSSLPPPTNKWYSGMVLPAEPKPGFNIPNSILPRSDGFELGLPKVSSTKEGIYGPHANGIQLSSLEASSYKLTRYDELTITFTYYDKTDKALFDATFASGSPYAFVRARADIQLTLSGAKKENQRSGVTTFTSSGSWYGVKSSNGRTGSNIRLSNGERLSLFSAERESDVSQLADLALNSIESGTVRYERKGDQIISTLTYKTANDRPTALAHLPHQQTQRDSASILSYRSIYGDLPVYKANSITYSQPAAELRWSLPLDAIDQGDKKILVTQLGTDIARTNLDKDDTYFGGKQLERLSQLVMVGDSLKETRLRDAALDKLKAGVAKWFDDNTDRSFYYDKTAGSLVGRTASFGSDTELNDHHFHYGYFIYAASVAAKFDAKFLKKYEDDVNLLVADIANYRDDEVLPLRRNFDAYVGHSWASGTSNYSDGNNQESGAEAINAWTATGLWGEITNNEDLQLEAEWMLTNEIKAVKSYWLNSPPNTPYAKNFTSPFISMNWGAKREYKTFFSDEPNAKLAIQLLPLNPTMSSYASEVAASVFNGADTRKPYGDYILMAQKKTASAKELQNYPDALIDGGNSKAYLMVYILSK